MTKNNAEFATANEAVKALGREGVEERLINDEDYYGDFGKLFISNSDIKNLADKPQSFRQPIVPNPALVMGSYFHHYMLEPEKVDSHTIVDASSRSTNVYKNAVFRAWHDQNADILEEEARHYFNQAKDHEKPCLMLAKERDGLVVAAEKLKRNIVGRDYIYHPEAQYEVPVIGQIDGEWFKGKADCVLPQHKLILDVKTTSDISKFHFAARRYGYDSQAYIYRKLFSMKTNTEIDDWEFAFAVVDKSDHTVGFYDCSSQFYESGAEKVIAGLMNYRMYYNPEEEEEYDWDSYTIHETLYPVAKT